MQGEQLEMRRVFQYGIVVLVILAALPFITGVVIQRQYDDWMNSFLSSNMDGFTVKTVEYHRGWLSSKALSDVRTLLEPEKAHLVSQTIQHGPFFGRHFGIAEMKAQLLLSEEEKHFFGADASFEGLLRINLLGDASIHLQGSAFHYRSPVGLQVKGSGVTWDWHLARGFRAEKSTLHFPSLELLQNNEPMLSFSDFKWLSQTHKNAQDLWIGDHRMQLGALYWFANAAPIEVRLLDIQQQMTEESGSLSIALQEKIESIQVDDALYGPIFLDLKVAPFDVQGIADLRDDARDEKLAQNPSLLYQHLEQIVSKRPTVQLERFQMDCPEGLLKAEGLFTLGLGRGDSIQALLEASTAHLSVEAAPALVRSIAKDMALASIEGKPLPKDVKNKEKYVDQLTDQLLKTKEQEGFLTLIDNVYHLNFDYHYKNGAFLPLEK